jgi:ANTAR domain
MLVAIGVEMNAGGECELDTSGRPRDPRRAGARILDTAEGVLIALRGCSLNEAFVEIVQAAKSHNVSTLGLADALVALAQHQASGDVDDAAFVAARGAWGHLFDRSRAGRGVRFDDEDGAAPGA